MSNDKKPMFGLVREPAAPQGSSALVPLVTLGIAAYAYVKTRGLSLGPRPARSAITFKDVAGVDDARRELADVVGFLKAPKNYRRLGARIPRGLLLVGAPGTGKTLLARAVAGEAGVPFYSMSGSAFMEKYVGVGAARVRGLFAEARKSAPCIVFIDEIDAVGSARSGNRDSGERDQTLNQLLIEMDGFTPAEGVVVLAATNRLDILDEALVRPGRFDRRVTLSLPDRAARRAILGIHTREVPLERDVDLGRLASQSSGMTPADLANVVNEAALLAARRSARQVTAGDLDAGLLRVAAGPEQRARIIPAGVKRVVAIHEVGHAVVMASLPHCDPVRQIQALPRGEALGVTVVAPEEDTYLISVDALRDRMAGLMGGRAAELQFTGQLTTGAQKDIAEAHAIARRMVTEFGMSALGPLALHPEHGMGLDLAGQIDAEVRALVDEADRRARAIVLARRAAIAAVADRLVAVETMTGDELAPFLRDYPAEEPATPA